MSPHQNISFLTADEQAVVSDHWGSKWVHELEGKAKKFHWWDSDIVVAYANRLSTGHPARRAEALLLEVSNGVPYGVAVSIGCGIAHKEMALLLEGVVHKFICFDLSEKAIEIARAEAVKYKLEDRIDLRCADGLQDDYLIEKVDLVYWNNSLHHMVNADHAIERSFKMLAKGGVFFMDDYVGPNRLQWTPQSLEIVNAIRKILPDKYFKEDISSEEVFLRTVTARDISQIISEDPSEALDSEGILHAVRKYFPSARIISKGGCIYQTCLEEIISNFDEANEIDRAMLELILIIDQLSINVPGAGSHYAVAIGRKESSF